MAVFPKSPVTPILATLLALGLPQAALANDQIGVTSAVNTQSTLERGAVRRTVVIGDDIQFQDKIITSRAGLTQVLFVDGSTFTVGSNSQVVIDEFVYDPASNSGALVSEVTKGALRFVGGKLSKNKNTQVQFKTPVGILGVRGGIAEIDLEPECDSAGACPVMTASLLFGNELTLQGSKGQKRVYQPGHAIVVYEDGRTRIVPVKSLNQRRLRDRLSGDPAQDGGADQIPTDRDVVDSGMPAANSDQGALLLRPRPEVVATAVAPDPDTPGVGDTQLTLTTTLGETAQSDHVRDDPEGEPSPVPPGSQTLTGVYGTPTTYETSNGAATVLDPAAANIAVALSNDTLPVTLLETPTGVPLAVEIGDVTLDYPTALGETAIAPTYSEEFDREVLGGTILRGPAGFAMYYLSLGESSASPSPESASVGGPGSTADSLFVVIGNPTPRSVFYPDSPDSRAPQVRTYTLGTDYARQSRGIVSDVRLLNPEVALAFGNDFLSAAAETPFYVVERTNLSPVARTLYAAINIEGQGFGQRSMVVSDSGLVYGTVAQTGADALGFGGTRRGSYRLSADSESVFMRGGTGSTQIDNPDIFTALSGPDAEVFVYSSGVARAGLARNSYADEDEFIDVTLSDPLSAPTSGLQYSSMMVPGILSNKDLLSGFDRDLGLQMGYAAGIVESANGQITPFRSQRSSDVIMAFDPARSSMGGVLTVADVTGATETVAGFRYAFGFDVTGEFPGPRGARSTYLDDDRFAANSTGPADSQGGDTTLLYTTDGQTIQHQPTTSADPRDPGTYVISSGLAPQPQLFADAGVTECQCDYMSWGWWGTQTEFVDDSLPGGQRTDFVHLGTWVTGDIPTVAELPTTGSASFRGHAIGNVSARVDGTNAQYIAAGDLAMDYDFGARSGQLTISNFDDRSFGGTMTGAPADNRFSGALSGSGLNGAAVGSFARGPNSAADGVLGTFNVGGGGYSATGTFMGSQ